MNFCLTFKSSCLTYGKDRLGILLVTTALPYVNLQENMSKVDENYSASQNRHRQCMKMQERVKGLLFRVSLYYTLNCK